MVATPRLNLPLIDPLSLVDPDNQLDVPFQIIDRGGNGAYVCTSTTRPTNPFDGMLIYETNTGKLLYYDLTNTAWVYFPGTVIDNATGPTTQKDITSSEILCSVAFDVTVGRRYTVNAVVSSATQITANGVVTINLSGTAGVPTDKLFFKTAVVNETVYANITSLYVADSSGLKSFHVAASSASGALRVPANQVKIWVEAG